MPKRNNFLLKHTGTGICLFPFLFQRAALRPFPRFAKGAPCLVPRPCLQKKYGSFRPFCEKSRCVLYCFVLPCFVLDRLRRKTDVRRRIFAFSVPECTERQLRGGEMIGKTRTVYANSGRYSRLPVHSSTVIFTTVVMAKARSLKSPSANFCGV